MTVLAGLAGTSNATTTPESETKWAVYISPEFRVNNEKEKNGYGLGASIAYSIKPNLAIEGGVHSNKHNLKYIGVKAMGLRHQNKSSWYTPYLSAGFANYTNPIPIYAFVEYRTKSINSIYAGFGVEFEFKQNISLRLDYKFLSNDKESGQNRDFTLRHQVASIGIGYKL